MDPNKSILVRMVKFDAVMFSSRRAAFERFPVLGPIMLAAISAFCDYFRVIVLVSIACWLFLRGVPAEGIDLLHTMALGIAMLSPLQLLLHFAGIRADDEEVNGSDCSRPTSASAGTGNDPVSG